MADNFLQQFKRKISSDEDNNNIRQYSDKKIHQPDPRTRKPQMKQNIDYSDQYDPYEDEDNNEEKFGGFIFSNKKQPKQQNQQNQMKPNFQKSKPYKKKKSTKRPVQVNNQEFKPSEEQLSELEKLQQHLLSCGIPVGPRDDGENDEKDNEIVDILNRLHDDDFDNLQINQLNLNADEQQIRKNEEKKKKKKNKNKKNKQNNQKYSQELHNINNPSFNNPQDYQSKQEMFDPLKSAPKFKNPNGMQFGQNNNLMPPPKEFQMGPSITMPPPGIMPFNQFMQPPQTLGMPPQMGIPPQMGFNQSQLPPPAFMTNQNFKVPFGFNSQMPMPPPPFGEIPFQFPIMNPPFPQPQFNEDEMMMPQQPLQQNKNKQKKQNSQNNNNNNNNNFINQNFSQQQFQLQDMNSKMMSNPNFPNLSQMQHPYNDWMDQNDYMKEIMNAVEKNQSINQSSEIQQQGEQQQKPKKKLNLNAKPFEL